MSIIHNSYPDSMREGGGGNSLGHGAFEYYILYILCFCWKSEKKTAIHAQ